MRLPKVKLLKRLESRPTPFANVKATNLALVAADRDTERAEALMIGEARNRETSRRFCNPPESAQLF